MSDGKQAIIEKIRENGVKAAESIVRDAQNAADASLSRAREEQAEKLKKASEDAKTAAEEFIKRRVTLAELDGRKLALAERQRLVDAAFAYAAERLRNLTDVHYKKFISGLLKRFAENGDRVSVSRRDEKVLDDRFFAGFKAETGIELKPSDIFHNRDRGVILSNAKCDKNLTVDAVIKQMRDECEPEVVEKLFGKV